MKRNVLQTTAVSSTPGLPGEPALSGAYLYTQTTSATPWIINHNLGFKPIFSVYSVGGVEVVANVIHISDNQTQIIFTTPAAGFARAV